MSTRLLRGTFLLAVCFVGSALRTGICAADDLPKIEAASDKPVLPFDVAVVYSPKYLINLGGLERMHPFDIHKYQKIHDALVQNRALLASDVLAPKPIAREDVLLVHRLQYLTDLQDPKKVASFLEVDLLRHLPKPMLDGILRSFRYASGGTLLAARTALKTGVAVNIGGGYHHAKPTQGEGFCLYADVPITIRRLQKDKLIRRAVVVDVDVHQGNGTILCLDNDPQTFTFSIHQGDIYPIPKERGDLDVEVEAGLDDDAYMKVLDRELPNVLAEAKADICFIVGGCDTLAGDPLASLNMTHQGIVRRDQAIVDACVERKIPVVLTLAGGYSKEAWKAQYLSIGNLIRKHGLAKRTAIQSQ